MLFAHQWDYWNLASKVTFDGELKTITVNPDVTQLDIRADVYSRWVDWRDLAGNETWTLALRYSGLDPIPGGFTGDSYFTYNGWKLLVDLTTTQVTGVLFSDDFSTAYYDRETGAAVFPAQVSSIVNSVAGDVEAISESVAAEVAVQLALLNDFNPTSDVVSRVTLVDTTTDVTNGTAAVVDTAAIASAVEVQLTDEFDTINSAIAANYSRLGEVWEMLGLDPSNPITIAATDHTSANITVTLTVNQDGSTTLTRTV